MYDTFENVIRKISELVEFLKMNGIEAEYKSYLEDDFLRADQFYEDFKKNPYARKDESGRAAIVGLYELHEWIWSVKDCKEFSKLKGHLKLLVRASPRINSAVPMISPVTERQDDMSNKFIEAIIGMFAVKVGTNAEIDDPFKSSGGKNPDVIFDFDGRRRAIACKTLRGKSERTVVDNLKSASKQIERAKCDVGYALFNAMNILPHGKIKDQVYSNPEGPVAVLSEDLICLYRRARAEAENEMLDIFQDKKMRPAVITFVHSVARLNTPLGITSTSLKSTIATDFMIPGIDVAKDIGFLDLVNEFMHNRL